MHGPILDLALGKHCLDIIGALCKLASLLFLLSSSKVVAFFFAGTSKVTIIPNERLANHAKIYQRKKNEAKVVPIGEEIGNHGMMTVLDII